MASDILIVDDEADIRELVSGILQDEGFETRTARDSDEAVVRTAAEQLDTVARQLDGMTIRKVIYVPGRLINIVLGR